MGLGEKQRPAEGFKGDEIEKLMSLIKAQRKYRLG